MKIGYARVSTDTQKTDLQMDALKQAGCEAFYSDEGVSGGDTSRPELNALIARLMAGDCVVVYKLDRLGRSLEHVMSMIKMFEAKGVHFKSLTEGFDTTTPAGKLLFHVIGSLAEFERAIIRERVNAGLEAARKRGTKLGRKPKYPPSVALNVYNKHAAGLSYAEIGRQLGISTATAQRMGWKTALSLSETIERVAW